ncbi:CLUMA_CG019282, isoform A [Clunio marinus]|uniref:CLUMA_CG019282, isoform A n=1 Tax=Clunio marinus TaxID=568069 RepID=A0A1J1J492_9DIPT|nr:CLUMA_CG019282, isoform A [Clunio marinus]
MDSNGDVMKHGESIKLVTSLRTSCHKTSHQSNKISNDDDLRVKNKTNIYLNWNAENSKC